MDMIAEAISRFFANLGIHTGTCVEVGAGDGLARSTTRGLLEQGWYGILIEGDATRFMRLTENTKGLCVSLHNEYISCEEQQELSAIIIGAGAFEHFEFLSLDIDGIDYWVLKQFDMLPKVILVEYNAKWGPEDRKTVLYDPKFRWAHDDYYGASAIAYVELLRPRGYVLVDQLRSNLLFARTDCLDGCVELPVESVMRKALHPPSPHAMIDPGSAECVY